MNSHSFHSNNKNIFSVLLVLGEKILNLIINFIGILNKVLLFKFILKKKLFFLLLDIKKIEVG